LPGYRIPAVRIHGQRTSDQPFFSDLLLAFIIAAVNNLTIIEEYLSNFVEMPKNETLRLFKEYLCA